MGLSGSDFVSAFDEDLDFTSDEDENGHDTFTIEFKNDGEPLVLPKYNQDGSRYIYAAREYLGDDGTGHYEQVFGMVDEATDTVTEEPLPAARIRTTVPARPGTPSCTMAASCPTG